MTTLLGRLLVGVVSVAFLCCGQETDSAAEKKNASIRELIAMTDASKVAKEMMEGMKQTFSESMPDFEKFWDEFASEIKFEELYESMVPIYARHLTQEDIDGTLAYYKSPAGRRMLEAMPKITREMMPVVMEWSSKIAEKVAEKHVNGK